MTQEFPDKDNDATAANAPSDAVIVTGAPPPAPVSATPISAPGAACPLCGGSTVPVADEGCEGWNDCPHCYTLSKADATAHGDALKQAETPGVHYRSGRHAGRAITFSTPWAIEGFRIIPETSAIEQLKLSSAGTTSNEVL